MNRNSLWEDKEQNPAQAFPDIAVPRTQTEILWRLHVAEQQQKQER